MELLAPAGNFEKLKTAVSFGADAVYFGGETFGLRAFAGNFTLDEMQIAMKYLHERGKRGYLTVNAYSRDNELDNLAKYIRTVADIGVDALIISDPGVFRIAKEVAPHIERHISTQANTTNSSAVNFWADAGATRTILARELKKDDLSILVSRSPIEVECFIHGAICISYSGRCLISAYMTGRDANRGECTQPCRWNYNVPITIQEATRPLQNMDMHEESAGTYLYNAKDLCLLDRIGELTDMGVASAKIEGRMKSVMYVAITTGVYRQAIDRAKHDPANYQPDPKWRELLNSVSNRHYTEGFYANVPDKDAMNYETSAYIRTTDFLGVVQSSKPLIVECRGKFLPGEQLQLITPAMQEFDIIINNLINNNNECVTASRAGDILTLDKIDLDVAPGTLLRRKL